MAKLEKSQKKRVGRRRCLSPENELEMARLYLHEGHTAVELVKAFAPLTRTGRLAMSSVIMIAQRVVRDGRLPKEKPLDDQGLENRQSTKGKRSRLQQTDDTPPDAAGSGETEKES